MELCKREKQYGEESVCFYSFYVIYRSMYVFKHEDDIQGY